MDDLRLVQAEDVSQFARIQIQAYPGLNINTPDKKTQFEQRILTTQSDNPTVNFYGLYRDNVLVGGMRFHDFEMNMLSTKLKAGGVGFVAVDIMRKKERIAKELLQRFISHYDSQGASMLLLYAFRTDFYHQMGFGFGGQMHQYRIPPSRLPKGNSKANVRLLTLDDKQAFINYHHRLVSRIHGMIEKTDYEINAMLNHPEQRIAAVQVNSEIKGHMIFSFKPNHPANFGANDIFITEMFYDEPQSLSELMTFLHSQADQIRTVIFNTQDDDFYLLMSDARNGTENVLPHVYHETNTSGVGLMYRVIDTERLFHALRDHDFNGVSCTVKFDIKDDFFQPNHKSTTVRFTNGKCEVVQASGDNADVVEVSITIADFSSLVMGIVPFRRLLQYGRAQISDPSLSGVINQLFDTDRPVCTAGF